MVDRGTRGAAAALLVALLSTIGTTGCVNTKLRNQLVTGQVPLPIGDYTKANLLTTSNERVVSNAVLQWVDHVQGRSVQLSLDNTAVLRIRRSNRYPAETLTVNIPLCDSFPERCAWVLSVDLSLFGFPGCAGLELKTISGELIEHLEACPRLRPETRTTTASVAEKYGVTPAEGQILWLFDQPKGACEGASTLLTRYMPAGEGEVMDRLVIARDLVLGTCDGGAPIVTLKAGSFVQFEGSNRFVKYGKDVKL